MIQSKSANSDLGGLGNSTMARPTGERWRVRDELMCLGSIIDAGNVALPPFLERLIQNAPESFGDPRAGEVAVSVRTMRLTGEPVNFVTLAEKHPLQITFLVGELQSSALLLESAEYYAGPCWRAYQVRRTQEVFAEAYQSIVDQPDQTQLIVSGVRKALDSIADDTRPQGFTVRTPEEILGMVFDDGDIILGDRILAQAQSCVIAAAGGAGKSRLSLQMAAAISTGRKFLNFTTGNEQSTWLFLQTENSNRRLVDDVQRIKTWLGDDWPKFATRVKFHTVENDTDSFVNLDSLEAVANLETAIKHHKPDIVVVDPLNDFAMGDLNKDADMKLTLQTLSRVCRKGNPKRAIVVLHHALTGKAGASKAIGFDRSSFGRNSKTLHAWTRAQINLAPADADNNQRLIVACGKCSNGREFPTFAIRLNPETMIYECDPTVDVAQWEQEMTRSKDMTPLMNPARVRELCAIAGSSKPELARSIMDDCGCVRQSAYRFIKRAEQARQIVFNHSRETYFRK